MIRKIFLFLFVLFVLCKNLKAQLGVSVSNTTSFNLKGKVKTYTEKIINGQIINGLFKNMQESKNYALNIFDTLGNLIEYSNGSDEKGNYYYNLKNQLILFKQDYKGRKSQNTSEYDNHGNLIRQYNITEKDTAIDRCTYDSLNNPLVFDRYSKTTYNGVQNTYTSRDERIYVGKLLKKKTLYASNNLLDRIIFYDYNSKEKLVMETALIPDSLNRNIRLYKYDNDSITLLFQSAYYNNREYIEKSYEVKDSGRTKIEKEFVTDGSVHSTSVLKYDKFRNVVESSFTRTNNRITRVKYYRKFNSKGLLVELEELTFPEGATTAEKRVHKYVYDKENNIIKDYLIVGNNYRLTQREITYN